jgi:hypothetical protein
MLNRFEMPSGYSHASPIWAQIENYLVQIEVEGGTRVAVGLI